jgi:Cu(I)/Ag(I) efflux system protein CusF
MNLLSRLALTAAMALASTLATAQHHEHGAATHESAADELQKAPAPEAAAADISEGEIRKVNKDTNKITIRHGELKNLEMPPMTMVFQVSDPAMLDQVKPGDKIRFVADKVGGKFTVMQLEVQD